MILENIIPRCCISCIFSTSCISSLEETGSGSRTLEEGRGLAVVLLYRCETAQPVFVVLGILAIEMGNLAIE